MDSFGFTGLENEESDQVEAVESKDVDFELGQRVHIQQHDSNATTTRKFLYGIVSSGSFFKSVASVAGIWQSSKRWSSVSILITMPLVFFVLIGESLIVFFCRKNAKHYNYTFCGKTRGYVNLSAQPDHNQDRVFDLVRFLSVAAQVFCFVAMSISEEKPFQVTGFVVRTGLQTRQTG